MRIQSSRRPAHRHARDVARADPSAYCRLGADRPGGPALRGARRSADRCGARAVTLCRELTKQFESVVTLAAESLPAWLEADPHRVRGEFVLVLHALPRAEAPDSATAHDPVLRSLLAVLPLKQAVALATELTGAARNALYERALALQRAMGPEGEAEAND